MDVYEDTDQVDDYNEDEWYDDDFEDECVFSRSNLCKAANGQLYISRTTAWAYSESEIYDSYYWHWETETYSIKDVNDWDRSTVIEAGKALKPGESIDMNDVLDDEDEDYEAEDEDEDDE